MRSIIFLLLFLRYSWSLPAQQVSSDDYLAKGSFFNPGLSYNYSIEFEVSTGFIALPKENSGNISVKGECLAGLDIYWSSLGRFKLYNCNFLQRAQKFEDENLNFTSFDNLTIFGQNLEKNLIYFKYDADQIISIHYELTLNDGALLNFQKSLLSTLFLRKNISALTEQIIYESDVFGKCPSQYDIVGDEVAASLSKEDSFQQITNSQERNDVILKRLKHIQMCKNPNSPVKYWFYNELLFEPKQECFYVIRDLSKVAEITCEEEYAVPITGTLTLVRTNFTLLNVGISELEEPFDLKTKNQGSIAYKPITSYSAPQIGTLEFLEILKKSVPSSEAVDDKFLSFATQEYERLLDHLKSQDDSNNIMSVWDEIQKLQKNQDKIEDYLKDILLECYQPGCARAKFLILKSRYDASFEQKVISSMGLHETAPDTLPLILEWCKRHESTHCFIALGNGLTFINKNSLDVPKPAPATIERVFAYIHSHIPADCRAEDNLLLDNAVISLHHAIELATNYSKLNDLHQSLEQCVKVHKLHYPVIASNALHVLENIPKIRENHLNQLMLEVIKDPDQITANKLQAFVVLLTRNSSDVNLAIDIYINESERSQLKSFISSLLLLDHRYNFQHDMLTIFRQKLYEKDYVPDMKPRYPYTNSHAFLIKHPLELSFIKTQDLEILISIIYDQRSYLPSDIQLEFMLKRDGGRNSLYAGITSAGPFLENVVNELWNSKNLFFDAEKLEIHELLDPFKSIYQTLQVLVKTYLPLNSLPPIEDIMEKFSKDKQYSQVLKDIISIINKNRQKNDVQHSTKKRTNYPDARFYITTEERMITYEPLETLVDAFLTTIKTKSLIDVIYNNLKDNHIINWISKLDINHVLPTICGIPVKIFARVKLGFYLRSLITETKSWHFEGRRIAHLDSSISMEIPKYWSGTLKTNLLKENNIKFDAKITSTVGKLNVEFEIPKSNYKTYNYDKDHAVVVNGQLFKMEKVDGKTVRQTLIYCDSNVMASILGFEICRQTSRLLYETYAPYIARTISAGLVSEENWLKPIRMQSTTLTISYQVKRRPSWNPFNYDNYYFSNITITISNNQSKIEIGRTYEPDTFWKLLITANGAQDYRAHLEALLSPPDKKFIVKLNGPDSYHNQYLNIQDKDITHQNSVEGAVINKQFTFVFHESDRSDWNLTADRLVTPSKLILKSTLIKRCNSFICNILFSRKQPDTTSISHFNLNYTLNRNINESILHNLDLVADIDGERNFSASLTYDFAQASRAFTVLSLYDKYPMAFSYNWSLVPTIKNPKDNVAMTDHHQFTLKCPQLKDKANIKISKNNKEFTVELDVSHLVIPSMSESFEMRFVNVINKDVNYTHQNYFGKVLYNQSSPHIHSTSQWEFQNNETHSDLLINCSNQYFNFGELYPSDIGNTTVWLNVEHDPLDIGYDINYESLVNKFRLNGKALNELNDPKYSRKDEWISNIPEKPLLNFVSSCTTNTEKNEMEQSCNTYNYFDLATFFFNVNYKNGLAFKMSKNWTFLSDHIKSLSMGTFTIVIVDNKGQIYWAINNLGIMEGRIFHTAKGLEASVLFSPKISSYGINSMKAASLEVALCGKRGLSYNITIYRRFRQIITAYFTNLYQEINQIVFRFHPYLAVISQYQIQMSPRFSTLPSETYDYHGYYVKPLPGIWLRNRLDYMLFAILDIPSSVLYSTIPWSEYLMERERFLSLAYVYFGKKRSAISEPLLVPDTKSFFVHHPLYWTEFGKAPEITISSLFTYIAQRSDVSEIEFSGFEVPRDTLYTYASIFEDQIITFDGIYKTLPKSPSACSHLLAHDGHSNRFSLMLLNHFSLLLYTQEWDIKISFMVKDCTELKNSTCSRSISITLNDEIITFFPYMKEGRSKNSGNIAIYFDDEKLNINLPGIRLSCEAHSRYGHEDDIFREHLLSCIFGLSPIYHANILGSLANNDPEPSNDLAGRLAKFYVCPHIKDVEQKKSLVPYKVEIVGTDDITWDFEACFDLYRWNYWSDLYDCFGIVDPTPYFHECRSHYAGMEDEYRLSCKTKLACQVIRQYQSMCNFRGITIDYIDTCDHKDFTLFPPYSSPSVFETKFAVIFLLDGPLSPNYIDLMASLEKEMAIGLKKVFNSSISVKYGLLSPYKLSDEWDFAIEEPRVELLPKSRETARLLDTIVLIDSKDSQVITKIDNGRNTIYNRQQLFAKALSLYKLGPDTTKIFVSISNDSIKLQSNEINIPFYHYQQIFWDKNILYITVNPDEKSFVNNQFITLGYPIHENLEITLNELKNKNKCCRVCLPSKVKYTKNSLECSYYPI